MDVLRQGVSHELKLALGLDVTQYPNIVLRFFQNGREILRKSGEELEVENGAVRLQLRADETALLSPQRFALEVTAGDGEKSVTLLSEDLSGLVKRSVGGGREA